MMPLSNEGRYEVSCLGTSRCANNRVWTFDIMLRVTDIALKAIRTFSYIMCKSCASCEGLSADECSVFCRQAAYVLKVFIQRLFPAVICFVGNQSQFCLTPFDFL